MAMNNQQPTKEQEVMNSLNEAFANLQAANTVVSNSIKAIQETAQAFALVVQSKDAKIKELEGKVAEKAKEEALVAKEVKNKK